MRTQQEIENQIAGLQAMRKTLPEFSAFGDNNWAVIDAQVEILQKTKRYEDFENEEYEIESAAYQAKEWLEGNSDEDLFEL